VAANSDPTQYQLGLRALSDRLVETQRPIRILDAIKWDESVQQAFFASDCRELPTVDSAYYAARPLGFDPQEKRGEFHQLERDIVRQLGQFNSVSQMMRRICREYQMVVRMLEARGTAEFARLSEELYGSAGEVFHAGDPTVADLGVMMSEALENLDSSRLGPDDEGTIPAEEAVSLLQERLDRFFVGSEHPMRVLLSDGIVADAAAGADYLKIRRDAHFSERDLRALEVHEGWVHMATTLNGMNQPYCTFLAKGPPSATITQEGLAIIMEVFAFASHPSRLRRLTDRIRAVDLAERGANFLEVFEFLREGGANDKQAYVTATRVFRGSTPKGGPFTKDLSYSKGFVLIYNYIRLAVRRGKLDRVPLLFCGKTMLEDIRTLAQLVEEGIVTRPAFLPPQFADLNALAAWMCYSNFLNHLSLQQIEADYAGIL
jgi:uncharacterized protein (TIGR02421 family)